MKVSRRFQLSVHTILFIAVYGDEKGLTCDYISSKLKCNPIVIKNILNLLCKNNFLTKVSSSPNIKLKKNINDITLWDIYKVTDEVNIKNIFCSDDLQITNPIMSDLPELLTPPFEEVMGYIKDTLSKVSIDSLLKQYNY
ncbi:Rrf2 family transcriptional regulator [Intestinibacter bartlettii]|uniref:Rrf2 family transcriptional regulator n=1 Tax=Intestinibacter bartlettii TaxID=261299 RepID=A0ABS6DV95_9FIRM|nr:Rrf2 family transcriptional regulator [Intestinibacter bartlettii]MBU5335741.1 Rrf2 family transcriptional regulator [Intestinibacter bartlettii]MDO5009761.1 Rrf2 family transcriptional regulator [Intestinibacter bartlettii]